MPLLSNDCGTTEGTHRPDKTRAILDGIHFDVVRATGQRDQLEIEMRAQYRDRSKRPVSTAFHNECAPVMLEE
jgi:hypothetical protein